MHQSKAWSKTSNTCLSVCFCVSLKLLWNGFCSNLLMRASWNQPLEFQLIRADRFGGVKGQTNKHAHTNTHKLTDISLHEKIDMGLCYYVMKYDTWGWAMVSLVITPHSKTVIPYLLYNQGWLNALIKRWYTDSSYVNMEYNFESIHNICKSSYTNLTIRGFIQISRIILSTFNIHKKCPLSRIPKFMDNIQDKKTIYITEDLYYVYSWLLMKVTKVTETAV